MTEQEKRNLKIKCLEISAKIKADPTKHYSFKIIDFAQELFNWVIKD